MSIYGFAGGTNEAACLCGCQERIRTLEAEVERLKEVEAVLRPGATNYNRQRIRAEQAQARVRELEAEVERTNDAYEASMRSLHMAEARVRALEDDVRPLRARAQE